MHTAEESRDVIVAKYDATKIIVGLADRRLGVREVSLVYAVTEDMPFDDTVLYFRHAACKTQYLWNKRLRIDVKP